MSINTLAPSITTRDPKGLKFTSVVEGAYNKAKLSDEEAQHINDTPGLSELVGNFIAENRHINRYTDKEVKSNYGYLSGYKKPIGITDQIDILRSHWPSLNPDAALRYYHERYPTLRFPDWVEGPFALIRPGFFSDKYGEELMEILKAIAKDRKGKLDNYREGCLGEEYLRQTERTLTKIRELCEQQPGSDILIVSEQFGIHYRGRSVHKAREVFVPSEYGEGAKNVGTMILTNPIRLQHFNDLWINCAGDKYSCAADGQFGGAPCFDFSVGAVRFNTLDVDGPDGLYGSASASLPQ